MYSSQLPPTPFILKKNSVCFFLGWCAMVDLVPNKTCKIFFQLKFGYNIKVLNIYIFLCIAWYKKCTF